MCIRDSPWISRYQTQLEKIYQKKIMSTLSAAEIEGKADWKRRLPKCVSLSNSSLIPNNKKQRKNI